MSYQKIIVFCCSLFLSMHYAKGQSSIKASVDKNRIVLGEIFTLRVEAELKENAGEKFRPFDTIPHFEFAMVPKIDTASSGNGKRIIAIYQLTSFDSGRWSIPVISLSSAIKTDSIPIDVVFSEFDPTQAYHDIKDIIETVTPKKKFPWWWIAAGVLLIGAAIYYFSKGKKISPQTVEVKSSKNAYEEAMQKLNALKTAGFSSKDFHSGVTDIFRTYVFKRKGIRSMQKTTADLVIQLRELDLEKAGFEKLSQALRLSDFVKFAKYEPSVDDDNEAWSRVRDAIIEIENREKKLSTSTAAP